MKIMEILVRDAVILDVEAGTKSRVLEEMAGALAGAVASIDAERLLEVLVEREALQSTGIGEGVAIPHGKLPGLDGLVAGFATSTVVAILGLMAWPDALWLLADHRISAAMISKLVPLAVFLAVGIFAASWSRIWAQPGPGSDHGNLGTAALLLLFAYAGFENTPAAAGEYKNPRRDVPSMARHHAG